MAPRATTAFYAGAALTLAALAAPSAFAPGAAFAQPAACLTDAEPNDRAPQAPAVSDAFCAEGSLAPSDQDLVLWTVTAAASLAPWSIDLDGPYGQTAAVQVRSTTVEDDGKTPAMGSSLFELRAPEGDATAHTDGLLLRPGRYLVAVVASGPGTYRVRLAPSAASGLRESEPNDSAATATPLPPATPMTGELAGSDDFFRFTVTPAQARRQWTLSAQVPPEEYLRLELQRASGETIFSYSDRVVRPIELAGLGLDAGEYLLRWIPTSPAATPYLLRLAPGAPRVASREDEPNGGAATARRLAFGARVSGRIGWSGDSDWYALDAGSTTGALVDVELTSASSQERRLCLTDAAGHDLQCRAGRDPRLVGLALPSTPSFVVVSGGTDPEREYTLAARLSGVPLAGFELEPNERAENASPMDVTQPIRARLAGRDTDVFRFTVAGETQLWTVASHGAGVTSLAVMDPRGRRLGLASATAGAAELAVAELLLVPGTYTAEIEGNDGEYTLDAKPTGKPDPSAEREPNDSDGQAGRLHFGVPRTGRLADERDRDCYRFSLAAPSHVALEVVPPRDGEVRTEIEWGYPKIKRPANRSTAQTAVYDAWLEPGDYLVRLTSDRASNAPYRITLHHRDPYQLPADREPNDVPSQAGPLPATLAVEGEAGQFRDDDWYALPALERPTRLTVEVTGDVAPRLEVGGAAREGAWDAARRGWSAELPANAAARLGVSGAGRYTLTARFADGPRPAPAPPPLPVSLAVDLGAAPLASYWTHGQRVAGAVTLTSAGKTPLTVDLDATAGDHRYRPVLAATRVTVAPGAPQRVPLEVVVAPNVWTDPDVQIAVRARGAGGASTSALGRLVVEPNADPLGEHRAFALPDALRGGFDVASDALGGQIEGAADDSAAERQAKLHDDLAASAGFTMEAAKLPATLTTRFGGGRAWTIAGTTIHPQIEGWLYPAEQLRDFELWLSEDGVSFERALAGSLTMLPVEQAFVLDRPRPARAAQLRLLANHADNEGKVGASEWKVIAVPGEPAGLALNVADEGRGGHVVWSDPMIGVKAVDQRSILIDRGSAAASTAAVEAPLTAGASPEWVVGFRDDRAARITSLEWLDGTASSAASRIGAVRVAVSTDGPLGPWRELGTWTIGKGAKGAASWALPQPTWARFVRFTAATPAARNGRVAYPVTLRIFEQPIGDGYLSILGEWGQSAREAIFEAQRPHQPAPTVSAKSPRASRASAAPLSLGAPGAGVVVRGGDDEWWSVEVPSGVEALAITASGDPTVDVDLAVEDGAGQPVTPRRVIASSSEVTWQLAVTAGERYRARVWCPPNVEAIAYDTSTSLLSFAPVVFHALMSFAEGVLPGRERVNFFNFESPPLLEEWSDQPWTLTGAVLGPHEESGSSDLPATALRVLPELAKRRGLRALIVVTDAETPYTDATAMWRALASIRPRIFTAHIGEGADPLGAKQLMQDLAAVNGGFYSSARTQAEMDVVAERAAAWLRRPARYRIAAQAVTLPAPRPGALVVTSGAAPPAAARGAGPASSAPANGAVELIFDASGSMLQRFEGKRRIDAAQQVLTALVTKTLAPGTAVALRAFGHDKPGSCATQLVAPLAALDPKAMSRRISAIRSMNLARTAIGASLAEVARDLASVKGPRTVVLVTDGEETCGGDPRAEIEKLAAQGFDVRVSIVGFAVDDAALKDTFRAWAALGRGEYYDAQSSADLDKALTAAVTTGFQVLDAAGAVAARGTVDGGPVALPAGAYRVEIEGTPPVTYEAVTIEDGGTARIEFVPR